MKKNPMKVGKEITATEVMGDKVYTATIHFGDMEHIDYIPKRARQLLTKEIELQKYG